MDDEKTSWIKRVLGINGHNEEPPAGPSNGGFQSVDRALATALVWCAAALLTLRFRNPEFGFVLGAIAVGVTIAIWRKKGRH
ncbi:MAG: hypothetical protein HY547_08365 [Elusimicrobia bacterium]|nr:hypothetical protein [Elusimicrobiota bacterium]